MQCWPETGRRLARRGGSDRADQGHSMGGLVIHSALAQAGGACGRIWSPTPSRWGRPHHGRRWRAASSAPTRRSRRRRGAMGRGSVGDSHGWRARSRTRQCRRRGLVGPSRPTGRPSHHPAARAQVRHHAVVAVAPGFSGAFGARVGDLVVPVASAERRDAFRRKSIRGRTVEMVRGVTPRPGQRRRVYARAHSGGCRRPVPSLDGTTTAWGAHHRHYTTTTHALTASAATLLAGNAASLATAAEVRHPPGRWARHTRDR